MPIISFSDRRIESLNIKDVLSNKELLIAHKFDQRLYNWGSKQIHSLITKTYKRIDETKFLFGFDSTKNINPIEIESRQTNDYYCLHQMIIFGDNEKFLTDGQQRTVTIIFLLNILKNKLIELSVFDKSERLNTLINLINSIIFNYNPDIQTKNNNEVLSTCKPRISYIDMQNYNKLYELILKNEYDKIKNICNKETDPLNIVRFKKIIKAYDDIEKILKDEIIKNTKNKNEEIDILYRYSRFIITRCYFDVVTIDNYDPIRRLEEFITINTDGLPLGIFDIYKVLLAKKIQNKNISSDLISEELIETFKNLEDSLSFYDCDNDKKIKDLLYLHYMVKTGNSLLRKSEIIEDINGISGEDSVLESKDLRNTAEILYYVNKCKLPKSVKDKFINYHSNIEVLDDLCERIHFQEREYTKLFFLVIYKNLSSFNNIKTLIHIFKRFNLFISKFSTLGDGGKSATDVRNLILKFRKEVMSTDNVEYILNKFQKIFFEERNIKKKFSINTTINTLMEKMVFKQGEIPIKYKRILLDIEYENLGGFIGTTGKIDCRSTLVTTEHILSVSKNINNPLIYNLGNVGGFLTPEKNSSLSDKEYSIKRIEYQNINSATLEKVSNNFKNGFTINDIIKNSGDMAYTYLKSIGYWLKPDPDNPNDFIEDEIIHNSVKLEIESKKLEMINKFK